MFYLQPCVYGHRILSHAASVFAAVRHMPPPPAYHGDPAVDASPASASLDPGPVQAETTTGRRSRQSTAKNARSQQPTFDFRSRAEKRLTFTLVFQTLKCEIRMQIRERSYHASHLISSRLTAFFSEITGSERAVKQPSSPWLRPIKQDSATYFVLLGRSELGHFTAHYCQ